MVAAPLQRNVALALLSEGFRGRPTLLAQTIAHACAARFLAAATEGKSLDLIGWTERTCASYGAHAPILDMLGAAPAIVCGVLRQKRQLHAPEDLLALESAIAAIVNRHLSAHRDAKVHRIDELDSTIEALIARLDNTDPASAEHSRSVALWCRRIARRLGLDDDESTFVARCGLLHDIGKITTPEEILLAPRALSAAEWEIMRDHPVAGEKLIAGSPQLRPFSAAVRSHHERLDGKGYPDGLHARDLSLAVRIVSVADSFNAMIARRPYRLPMPPTTALEELERHRGTQFDPTIVETMISVVEKN
jgi:putative nucleotidyltransferase with HDIG domain